MALNEALYSRLVQKFGRGAVEIVRPGEPYRPNWVTDPITGRKTRNPISNGEAYRLCCPKCGDQKGRLYVNHFWMQWDEDVHRHVDDMIKCFNEERCFDDRENRSWFYQLLFGDCDPRDLGVVSSQDTEPPKEVVPEPPGKIISLRDLHPQQSCCYYLRGREYDIETLVKWWDIGYVATVKFGHHPDCINRIYIPMIQDGVLVGYQCRYIGDREWTAECPKYRTMPKMKRGQYLYNIDNATRSRVVVLVEGPTSAWRVGPRAVALWGNSMSPRQATLLKTRWKEDCLIVVMLDGKEIVASEKIAAQLRANCDARVLKVQMDAKEDPGTLGEANCWSLIQETGNRFNIDVWQYLHGENRYEQPTGV